jgi:glycosyltransferase involved in cell wall biosynthesis
MGDATVSVALATHNGERFIEEQLRSLARQTLLPHELVVGDDGSTDATLEIIDRFAAGCPFPVRVYRNERNLGFADNFLKTAGMCSGDLIAFCDQDDIWLPGKLARCAAALSLPDVLLAIHSCELVDTHLRPLGSRYPRIRASEIAGPLSWDRWYRVRGMAMVFSAELMAVDWSVRPRSHYRPGAMLNHDEWIYLLARVSGSIAFIEEVLAAYRQHDANLVGAPRVGLPNVLRELPESGARYYAIRAAQAQDAADLFARLASEAPQKPLEGRYAAGASFYGTVAELLEERVKVYAPDTPALERARTVLHLLLSRAYGRRSRGGLGPRSFLKDAIAACIGWWS